MTDDSRPSKSQRKRDMDDLKVLARRLAELSIDQLSGIENPAIREAIAAAKKITKGNARKRQIQYIAKLMAKIDTDPIRKLVDTLDASSVAYVQKFHQLEVWREQLINGDQSAMDEILSEFPHTDRQQLRHLVKSATREHEAGLQNVHFRRVFQFLKTLDQGNPPE